jgi:hypothetical protein
VVPRAARSFTFSRLESVQHEALLTLWAARAGVSVPDVLTAGAADDEIALLAVSAGGRGSIDFRTRSSPSSC